jgi:HlyD family secretion protein
VIVILGVLAIAGFLGSQWWAKRTQAAAAQPTGVRVEPVVRGNLIEFISAPGEVEPKTRVSISARVSARIARLPFREGDKVTKGDPNANPPVPPSILVKLDDRELDAQLKSVQARFKAQQAQLLVSESQVDAQRARIAGTQVTLTDAKRQLELNQTLLAPGDVSKDAVAQLEAKVNQLSEEIKAARESLKAEERNLKVLEHNIAAAAADIAKAEDNLKYATIESPIDGVVTRLNAEEGELVVTGTMNNAGTMILEVADLSQMIVKARVDENAIADVKVGQKCRIRMEAYRDKVFEGTVQNVALANFDPNFSRGRGGNSQSRMFGGGDAGRFFEVEILLNTEGKRIFQGLTADVDIETNRHDEILKIPSQSVLGRAPDSLPEDVRNNPLVDKSKATVPVVFRFVNNEAVATPVTIGASDLTHTVITAGLKQGDTVITGPYKILEPLQHGAKVKSDRASTAPVVAATGPTTAPANLAGYGTTQPAAATQATTTRPASVQAASSGP